ncbi:MAG: hypothetical protein KGZ35_06835 [Truepera sp.]|nr:hypothetical protein [Truepera sp.]
MVNPIYQATVTALEALLSPRVVSRLLQEGLLQVGKSPETVSYPEIETILKAQVYRQLQVAMPVVKAKEVIQSLLAELAAVQPTAVPAALKAQGEALAELKKALLPFNLYFEWPETQKLRAQLQLLEAEQQAGRAAEALLQSSQDQLALLRQKLEDQLVIQARELSELQAALLVVRSLGGPKVRRLENLLQQIASEQQRRQLAPAEIERARKLATDLRKLMESSVVNEIVGRSLEGLPPVPTGGLLDPEEDEAPLIDMAALDPEISSRLLLIDVERESQELNALTDEYANLLGLDPALKERVAELYQRLMQRQPLGGDLSHLRSDLQLAQGAWRGRLSREFRDLAQQLERLLPDGGDAALAVQVSLSILETTLPAPADIEQARELAALAREAAARQREVGSALQLKLNQQAQAIEQLQRIAKRYQDEAIGAAEGVRLKQALATLEGVHSQGHLSPEQVTDARQLAGELEGLVARQATALDGQRAQVRSLLHQVEALPMWSLAAAGERLVTALKQQLLQLDVAPLAPAELAAAKAWVDKFKNDLREAYQGELSRLMAQARDLGDTEALSYIRTALVHSESGLFPSLTAAHEALTSAVERHRAKQLRELHQLETESRRYAHAPEFAELSSLLQAAKADLTAGQLARGLKQGRLRLEALRQQSAQQAESFLPRLDFALSTFEPLARLNSDDSHMAGRILSHLDSQREAFSRVSPAMQHELLTALRQAEELLEVLRDEYEATRAVADQLVSSNAIDDLLGLFDAPSPEPVVVRGRHPALDDWLDSYLSVPGVRCAAILAASEMLAGRLSSQQNPAPVQAVLRELIGRLTQLGDRLALGAPRLLTLELSKQSVVVQPALTCLLVIVLDVPTGLSLVLHKLRRELPALTTILRDLSLS